MKLWPLSIIAVFVLFAGFIAYLMVGAMKVDASLVSETYYADDLAFDQHVAATHRADSLGPLIVRGDASTPMLSIQVPAEIAGAKGTLTLFHPMESKKDRSLQLDLTEGTTVTLPTEGLTPGTWKVKIQLTQQGKVYYWEVPLER